MNPNPLRRLLGRLARPQGLRPQLMAVLGLVTATALLALHLHTGSRLDHAARDASQELARELVRMAATSAAPALTSGDVAAVEPTLRALASLPDVHQLVLLDAEGNPALALQRLADGRVVRAQPQALPAPSAIDPRQRRWATTGHEPELVQAWAGAGPGGSLGSAACC